MSDAKKQGTDNTIYRDFCIGMKNQTLDQLRLAGEIARRASQGASSARNSDILYTTAHNFAQLETNLENIEDNLNKVCALTRQTK